MEEGRVAATRDERALFQAAEFGNISTLTFLLREGVSPHVYDEVCGRRERERERDHFNLIF